MVDTIKFSEFLNGGDLENDDITVGLGGGANTRFNNPWTFLKPGTTAERPTPSSSISYRLRFNATLEIYEYYDPTTMVWAQLSGTGTGTVNPGSTNDIAFYAAAGQAVSAVASGANSVLVSNISSVPSMSTTLPVGLSIPGAAITSSTAALSSGSVVAAPVAGADLVNKTYADSLFGSGVRSLTGTVNQITFSSPTGNIIASLPQDIAPGSTPSFLGLTLTSMPLGISSGGTNRNSLPTTFTASSYAAWDANSNLSANSFIPGFASTVTSGGNTILTVASRQVQEFTGTSTHTVTMPVTSTLVLGQPYEIINNSTQNLTVNSSGGNLIQVMAADTTLYLDCILTSGTTAASWNKSYVFDNGAGVLSITGTTNQVIASASTGAITLSLPQSIATSSGVTFGSVTFSTISGIIGTTTNNNAAAGSVGELISSQVFIGAGVPNTSGVATNVTSISLTAGDWDLSGTIWSNSAGATTTNLSAWISTVSATTPVAPNNGLRSLTGTGAPLNGAIGQPTGNGRLSLASTTTVYLSGLATYTGGAMSLYGYIGARRVR